MALRRLEDQLGRRLGDIEDPLLVSVRSGAKFSMPGMMETVLNVGLNDYSVKGLAEAARTSGSPGTPTAGCCRCSARPCSTSPASCSRTRSTRPRTAKGVSADVELSDAGAAGARRRRSSTSSREQTGREFPQDPREQLDMAMRAVFDSWNTDRARLYRRRERIPQDLGTAVNVCTMVFGNLGETSGTGVCFTRDPATGKPGVYGDYLTNAQGEDVVAGIRNTLSLDDFARLDPTSHGELHPHHAPAGDALPRPVRHRVHRRARQAVDAADPRRQAHGRGRVPHRHPARRRAADHAGRGAAPGHRPPAVAADVPAVRPGRRPRAAHEGHGRLAGRGGRRGGVRLGDRGRAGRRGRAGAPGPPGDQPRRPGGHDRRGRHPDQPRRQDHARRGRRARHGQHLRLRRRGARRRRRGADRARRGHDHATRAT